MTAAALIPQVEATTPTKQMGPIRHNVIARKGTKFANDGSYVSVEALLTRLASRCFYRVEKLELAMTYDDVRQEMDLSYVQAFRAWDPARGVKFASYLTNACLNNFRKRIEKMANERREMGMYSYDANTAQAEEDGDLGDPLDRIAGDMVDENRPEDHLSARQEIAERLRGLTPAAQRFVTALLLGQTRSLAGSSMKFSNVAIAAGLSGPELKRVKKEITEKFGFDQW